MAAGHHRHTLDAGDSPPRMQPPVIDDVDDPLVDPLLTNMYLLYLSLSLSISGEARGGPVPQGRSAQRWPGGRHHATQVGEQLL